MSIFFFSFSFSLSLSPTSNSTQLNPTQLNPTHQLKTKKKNQIPPLLLPLPHPLPPSLVLRPPLLPLRHHRLRHQFRSPLNPPQRNGLEYSRLAMFGHSAIFGRGGCDVDRSVLCGSMESAIAVYFGELCGCGGWYVLFFSFSLFFVWNSRPHERKKLLMLYENIY